jgi:3-hydroxybutyryl-CoA dehydratase
MRAAPALEPGDEAVPRQVGPVTQTDIVRFAGAGGDFNPLHHDEAAARAAGFPGVLAMGQFTAGALAGLLTDWVGIENVREFEVRFLSPVFIGDVVRLTAAATEVADAEANIRLSAMVGDREAVRGTARVTRSSRL